MSTQQPVRLHRVALGEGRTKIIVPLMPRSSAEVPAALAALEGEPVDIIEWRVDYVSDPELAVGVGVALRTSTELPILLTYRTDREGGEGALPDSDYADLVSRLLRLSVADGVDVEYRRDPAAVAAIMEAADDTGLPVIASFHDFERTPSAEEILGHLRAQAQLGADVLKVALMPRSMPDVAAVLSASAQASAELAQPLIAISMGRLGLASRVAGGDFGSCATFASAGESSAPGQVAAGALAQALAVFEDGAR